MICGARMWPAWSVWFVGWRGIGAWGAAVLARPRMRAPTRARDVCLSAESGSGLAWSRRSACSHQETFSVHQLTPHLGTWMPTIGVVHWIMSGPKNYSRCLSSHSRARRLASAIWVGVMCFARRSRLFFESSSPCLYRGRNAIERMFGRIKDFRRIATRYDKLGRNFLAAVCLVATVCYWL